MVLRRRGHQGPDVAPQRSVVTVGTQQVEEPRVVIHAEGGDAPPRELALVFLEQLQDRLAQLLALSRSLGVQRLGVVDPGHQDRAEGVEVDDEVEGSQDVVEGLSRGAEDESMAVRDAHR